MKITHKRNIEGLIESAKKRRDETLKRADEGIKKLIKEGKSINFKTLSEAANISTTWIYKQPEISERIKMLRSQEKGNAIAKPRIKTSDASKDAMCAAFKNRIKQLEEENKTLKKQIEVLYGQIYKQ
ncbi:DUF6262 family protein [Clostridium lacusfryxellense]|uniref:DUF6262 family protein n=1 Tax=Clostridium lacusfryxellense TaxID=205328 RepID=UPI001C0DDED8|nr:DUF6262 family protein [Clostridium lacusfryxellense]MBU3114680.1 transposase [Clostridium lacusfryxellense]